MFPHALGVRAPTALSRDEVRGEVSALTGPAVIPPKRPGSSRGDQISMPCKGRLDSTCRYLVLDTTVSQVNPHPISYSSEHSWGFSDVQLNLPPRLPHKGRRPSTWPDVHPSSWLSDTFSALPLWQMGMDLTSVFRKSLAGTEKKQVHSCTYKFCAFKKQSKNRSFPQITATLGGTTQHCTSGRRGLGFASVPSLAARHLRTSWAPCGDGQSPSRDKISLSVAKVICAETKYISSSVGISKARRGHRHAEGRGCKKLLEKVLENVLGRRSSQRP